MNLWVLHLPQRFKIRSKGYCRRGGIGRHAALRWLWRKPWRFESARRYKISVRMSVSVYNIFGSDWRPL